MSRHPLRLSFFGAPADTGNLGLEALLEGFLTSVGSLGGDVACTVFDNGWGTRPAEQPVRGVTHQLQGARLSQRWDRPESYARIALGLRLRGRGNAAARTLLRSDAVLDVSGGDSFADLYGEKRFAAVAAPKRLALRFGLPLVLLPQTYGPFRAPAAGAEAARLVRGARVAWARDSRSLMAMRELLGDDFDPQRHRQGMDMAFALAPRPPRGLPAHLDKLLDGRNDGAPVVGVNVSGLVYNDPGARERYGLSVDYCDAVRQVVTALVASGARVLLVPHVVVDTGAESDLVAGRALRDALDPLTREEVHLMPAMRASEVKGLIARLDWFCGTRLHSTIAGLSTGVPTDAVAYSLKFEGVFASCGQQQHVHEARTLGTQELVERLLVGYAERDTTRPELHAALPAVHAAVMTQTKAILRACDTGGST